MVETFKPSNINLETILLFKNRKVEFTKMETIHSLDFHDVELNKKVPIQIITKQHSINGEIKIFLDPYIWKHDPLSNLEDIVECVGIYGINSDKTTYEGAAYGNTIFFNTKKVKNLEVSLIHELQHAFDYYIGIMPSAVEAHNESEYRAILAEIVLDKYENVMNKYNDIKQDAILTEQAIESCLKRNVCALSRRDFPHSWANMKILRELNYMDFKNPLRLDIIDSLSNEKIIERSKILLNNEYRRLTGKSYDELIEDLIEKAKKGE